MEHVGLARGKRSYDTVRKALELISRDVRVPSNLPVLIKVNMVAPRVKQAATPVQAVQAVMDFLREKGVKKFIIAEGTTAGIDTLEVFKRFGYLSLKEKYDVDFRDLNQDKHLRFEALAASLQPVTIRLAKSFLDCYLVSVAPMKTHIQVTATLTIKNLAIGFILNPDRRPLSGGLVCHEPKELNLSIARLAKTIVPHLAVADGVVGMEGNGPIDGAPVASGVAVAGTNALAVDLVGTQLMGFDPRTIGYLWYLSQMRNLSPEDVEIVGEDVSQCITRYIAPDNQGQILGWWVENWRKYVQGDYLLESP